MNRLLDGYRRFRVDVWEQQRSRFDQLAAGHSPETLVIACSDARVDPQMVFDAAPGELFVVRNVAALVPPFQPDGGRHGVSAALEFGVRVLKVKQIVVLGHAMCDAVQALVEGAPEQARDFVQPWMSIAEPVLSRDQAGEKAAGATQDGHEMEVVKLSLANLLTFPWIEEAVRDKRLGLHGMRFDIRSGNLWRLSETGRFLPVDAH
jgi:carbonic anhydrase